MQVHNPSTSTLKCPTCRLDFNSEILHKEHYKSDFHRYNLKRSMVSLQPATFEQFSTKRLETIKQRQTTFQCGQCKKIFASLQTLNQHGQSKKHEINKIASQKAKQAVPKPKIVALKNQKLCLFCLKQSESIELNLTHMSTFHSFFIAQSDYCSDKKALLHYLQQKIEVGMLCIFCDNKGAHDFTSGDSVRKHMLSKNHTFMNTQNGFEQYENFYDFSQLFKAKLQQQKFFEAPPGINFEKVKVIVDDEKVKQKTALKKKQEDKMEQQDVEQWQDEQNSEGDEEWQDDSDYSDEQTKMIQQEDEIKQKTKRKIKAYNIMVPTITGTDELLLPNGKTLGHRKYRRFYKQSIKLNNWFENNNLKMLENGTETQNTLTLRKNILDSIRRENLMKNNRVANLKKQLKVGMNNNVLMKFFRTSCSLG